MNRMPPRLNEELAEIFLGKADGVKIFTKLPSMFPSLYKERQKHNAIEKLRGRLERSDRRYGALLSFLTRQRVPARMVASRSIANLLCMGSTSTTIKNSHDVQTALAVDSLRAHTDLPSPVPTEPLLQLGILSPINECEEAELWAIVNLGADDAVIVQSKQWTVHRSSLRRLTRNLWMNDESINYFAKVICKNIDPLSYVFNTFFYARLVENDNYCFGNVARWTRGKQY